MRPYTRRPAFTLLELLVVLAIMGMLMALTAGAVFRVMATQREKNTNVHLTKIYAAFQVQYDAKVRQIDGEPVPQYIKDLTKNADGTYDVERGKALHLKLRLREEFPQTFGDIDSTLTLTYQGQTVRYGNNKYFLDATAQSERTPPRPAPGGSYTQVEPEEQGAALLLMILSRGNGSATVDPETIARTKTMNFPRQGGGTYPLRVFVDEFGKHISFRIKADDDQLDVLSDMNQPPYVTPQQVASGNMDKDDPRGRLKIAVWSGTNRTTALGYLSRSNPSSRPYYADPFDGTNRGPFVFSAGKNRDFFNGADDNLYSHRLAQFGGGKP